MRITYEIDGRNITATVPQELEDELRRVLAQIPQESLVGTTPALAGEMHSTNEAQQPNAAGNKAD